MHRARRGTAGWGKRNLTGRRSERVRALDGLRALAVVAVVLLPLADSRRGRRLPRRQRVLHAVGLPHHDVAARRAQRGTGASRSARFWGRRARRLLPAAYVALAGVAACSGRRSRRPTSFARCAATCSRRSRTSRTGTSTSTGQSYAHLFSAPSPVLHFWSLAIEEQFYLVFPLLVLVAMRGCRAASASVLGALSAAGVVASVVAGRIAVRPHRGPIPRLLRHRHPRRRAARRRAARRGLGATRRIRPATSGTRPHRNVDRRRRRARGDGVVVGDRRPADAPGSTTADSRCTRCSPRS